MTSRIWSPRSTNAAASSRGQAMVEFALVAPIFFLLLFGVIEAGRFILYYQTLANATREGARYAIVHGWNSSCPSGPPQSGSTTAVCDRNGANVVQRVSDSAFGLMGAAGSGIPCGARLCVDNSDAGMWPDGDNYYGRQVRVRAEYRYSTLLPLPLPAITVSGESTLVINN
jgi:hypothetical protein